MRYGSLFSGIEAASTAWHPLGWQPQFFSEIEPFPCSVLQQRFPSVPNYGDVTKFQEWPDHAIDLLIGGSPCQSFSIAGLRAGLADPRGNLMLTYLAVVARYRPKWMVWENVPGVLSSNGGRDFGTFLGALGQLGYGFAYRVLDAQHVRSRNFPHAVPQRRRRVFVVGYLGDWRRAAAVLFDAASLRGDSTPRREAGKRVAPTISSRPTGGGGLGTDFDLDGGLIASTGETETMVAHALRGEGFDASEDGTGRGAALVPIAFSSKDHDADAGEIAPTLRSMGHHNSHANGGGQVAVAFVQNSRDEVRLFGDDGATVGALAAEPGMKQQSFIAHPVAFGWQNSSQQGDGVSHGFSPTLDKSKTPAVQTSMAVRRLTPTECERLQGFPDGWTMVTHRKKPAADGPRYKALGNSMAVNVMQWIGERIELVEGQS